MRTVVALVIVVSSTLAAGCDDADDSSDTFTVTMPARSMEPTIEAGSRVTVTKVAEDYEQHRAARSCCSTIPASGS